MLGYQLLRINFVMASDLCHELPTASWNVILTVIFGLLISVIACTTNALTLMAVYKKQSLHTVTNYFVAALALSDFFVGFFALPLWVARSLLHLGDEAHPLSVCVDCVYVSSVAVSTYNLCAVSLERYIGVLYPLRYNTIVTVFRFKCVAAIICAVSSFIASLRLIIREDDFWITAVCTVFIFPGVVISYCYFYIFKEVLRQQRTIREESGPVIVSYTQNRKAAITVAIVTIVFYLTTFPALAFSIVEVSDKHTSCEENQSSESWGTWALFLTFSNAALNPWIYAARKKEFRDALKTIMFWKQQE